MEGVGIYSVKAALAWPYRTRTEDFPWSLELFLERPPLELATEPSRILRLRSGFRLAARFLACPERKPEGRENGSTSSCLSPSMQKVVHRLDEQLGLVDEGHVTGFGHDHQR